jgi:hypothetical protein
MLKAVSLCFMLSALSSASWGQQSLAGTYRLVSQVLEVDGVPREPMGKAPRGQLALTKTRATVFYTAQTREFGTAEAAKARLFDTLAGWTARYRVEGNRLILSIDASWVENWNGKDQIRNFQLSGNRLTLTSDPGPWPRDPSKKSSVRQVWEKLE